MNNQNYNQQPYQQQPYQQPAPMPQLPPYDQLSDTTKGIIWVIDQAGQSMPVQPQMPQIPQVAPFLKSFCSKT